MTEIKLYKIITIAKTEYIKWITNPRMIIMVIMIPFLYDFIIKPLLSHADEMNSPLNILEPFIATGNSNLLMIMMPIIYLVVISDFPRTDGNTLFFITRVGKLNWLFGQMVFGFFTVFTFLLYLLLITIIPVILKGFLDNGWSLVTTNYAVQFPENSKDFASTLIIKNLYNQVTPFTAVRHIVLLTAGYFYVIILVKLLFYNIKIKILGTIISGCLVAFGGALCLVKSRFMWILPMAHTNVSYHFTEYFRETIVSLSNSYLYFFVLINLGIIICCMTIKKLSIETVQELD